MPDQTNPQGVEGRPPEQDDPIWQLCDRIDAELQAIQDCAGLDGAVNCAEAAGWLTAEIRGYVRKLRAELAAADAAREALRVERDELQRLWEEVGKHIDAACIGYNHPQIKAVFHLHSEQRKTIFDLTVRAETAEAEVARLRAQLDEELARRKHMQIHGRYLGWGFRVGDEQKRENGGVMYTNEHGGPSGYTRLQYFEYYRDHPDRESAERAVIDKAIKADADAGAALSGEEPGR